MPDPLHWDTVFEIASALQRQNPQVDFETVSLENILDWTLALPNFEDEPELANDEILLAIYQEWYEEQNPL